MDNNTLSSLAQEAFKKIGELEAKIIELQQTIREHEQKLLILNNGLELDYHTLTEEMNTLNIRIGEVESKVLE